MQKKVVTAALVVLVLPSVMAQVGASDSASHISESNRVDNTLPPLVVEASRLDKTPLDMPQFVEVITAHDIAQSGVRDVPSLLARQAGVVVHRMGGDNPQLAQVSMRGYGENGFGRVLMMVDGEKLNNADMSAPSLACIPMERIEKIEVLHGPQTVLYGDNASAGMVNVVTEPLDYKRETSIEVKGGSWDTFGTSFDTRGGFEDEGLAYWGGGSWLDSDGFRDHSGYEIWQAGGGIREDWENGSWLKLSTFYTDADYDLPGGLTREEWQHHRRNSKNHSDEAWLDTYGLSMAGKGVINDENALKLNARASHRDLQGHYVGTGWDERTESKLYSYEVRPQYVWNGKIGSFDNELTVGSDVEYDVIHSQETYTGSYANMTKPKLSRWMMGGYAHDEFFLTDELSLVGGVRLARSMARNDQADKAARNDNVVAWEAALNERPTEDSKLYLAWKRFYRNPFLDETPWYTNPQGSYVPKNILSPERGYSVDVGGDWEWAEGFNLGGVLFVSETDREVFYDSQKYANVNADNTVLREGFEGHTGWTHDKLAGINLRYAFTYAKFEDGTYDDKDIPLVPRNQVRLEGKYWLWDECFIQGGYQYCAKQVTCSDFANRYDRLPDYGIFNAGIQYEPENKGLKGLKVAFEIENLLDKNYATYATQGTAYYPGAGRCFLLSVKWNF